MDIRHIFESILHEAGGQEAGKLEVIKIDLEQAREYTQKLLDEMQDGKPLNEFLPNFDINFKLAQSRAKLGKTQRKDMPVIDTNDVKSFQSRLKDGVIDIHKPLAKETDPKNPFPEGLSQKEAKEWMKNGLKDNVKPDDQIKVSLNTTVVEKLKPIQKQIYFDKSIGATVKNGVDNTVKFFTTKSILIKSSDNYIIDGHHRWLSCILVNPKMSVPTLEIDLPINKLLPLSLAYGDAIGNKRNK